MWGNRHQEKAKGQGPKNVSLKTNNLQESACSKGKEQRKGEKLKGERNKGKRKRLTCSP